MCLVTPSRTGFDLTLRPERLGQPLKWSRPRMIFVNSMSDLFHKQVPVAFIDQVFDTMEKADWHTFQVLTKRSSLMRDYLRKRYGGEARPQAHLVRRVGRGSPGNSADRACAHLRGACPLPVDRAPNRASRHKST